MTEFNKVKVALYVQEAILTTLDMGRKNLAKARIYSALIALNYIMLPVYWGLDINTLKQ